MTKAEYQIRLHQEAIKQIERGVQAKRNVEEASLLVERTKGLFIWPRQHREAVRIHAEAVRLHNECGSNYATILVELYGEETLEATKFLANA